MIPLLLLWSTVGAVWIMLAPETIPSAWSVLLLIFAGGAIYFP